MTSVAGGAFWIDEDRAPGREAEEATRMWPRRAGGGGAAKAVAALALSATAMASAALSPAAAPATAVLLRHTLHQQEHTLTCEVAALVSALSARGIAVAEAALLARLPVDPRPMQLRGGPFSDYVSGPDPYVAFAGDINGREFNGTGYGVYYPPIVAVAQQAGATATGGEGVAPATVYAAVLQHRPSVVWAQKPLRPVARTKHYTADDGRVVPYAYPEHAYALVGVDPAARTVVLMNPFDGTDEVASMADFEASYGVFGDMAVTVSAGVDAGTAAYPRATPPAAPSHPASPTPDPTPATAVSTPAHATPGAPGTPAPALAAPISASVPPPPPRGAGAGGVVGAVLAGLIVATAVTVGGERRRRRPQEQLPAGVELTI